MSDRLDRIHPAIRAMAPEVTAWRRDIHAHPELGFDVQRTAGFVANRLGTFGVDEIVPGVGRTGVVAVVRGRGPGPTIALRADMDALPIEEETNLPWRSTQPGKMHACGHDGHTAILLGTARHLAATRDFDGTAVLVFQPAEEGGGGAKVMLDDGLMERFGVDEVYGLHNMPGVPVGSIALRTGPLMAAADHFSVRLEGLGGHAARPHAGVDTTLVAAHLVVAAQSVVSRNVDPLESAVLSITMLKAGETFNVIPQHAELRGTVRSLTPEVRDLCEARFRAIVDGVARTFGAKAEVHYVRGYPVTRNHALQAAFAASVAGEILGEDRVTTDTPPVMGAEDFSFMLESRPGAYVFLGNGDTAGVHNPGYDFDDAAIPYGIGFLSRLVERGGSVRGA